MSLVCLFAVFHLEAYTITTFRGSWTLIMIAASLHCRCRSSRRSRDVCIFYTKTALWQRRDCQQLSSLWRQAVCCKFSLFANQTKRMRSQHDNFVIATVMSTCISFLSIKKRGSRLTCWRFSVTHCYGCCSTPLCTFDAITRNHHMQHI